jgi:glutathione S-transferase
MSRLSPGKPIRLYRRVLSGHAHRVELFLALLRLPYELIEVDLPAGENRRPEFLKKSPFGQIPVIEDEGVTLYDSNAILVYLATKYDDGTWLPKDPVAAAKVQQWLSLCAGPIAYGLCNARLVVLFDAPYDHEWSKAVGSSLLTTLNEIVAHRRFAIGDIPTIADVSAYGYIARAPEGGVSLEPYPNVRAWLQRIEALPDFVPLRETKSGAAAA